MQQQLLCRGKPQWWILLPLLMAVSTEATSGSSYSITLLSKHWLVLHTHTLNSLARTHTNTHKPQTPTKSVGFEIYLPPFRSEGYICKLGLSLPVGRCARADPGIWKHALPSRLLPVLTAGPRARQSSFHPLCQPLLFNSTPPLMWLFWNNLIPPEAEVERSECSWTSRPYTSRAPRHPPSPPCAPCAPSPSQAGESYVTGCYVIAADRVLLCSAQLRNIIPCCWHKFPPH